MGKENLWSKLFFYIDIFLPGILFILLPKNMCIKTCVFNQ